MIIRHFWFILRMHENKIGFWLLQYLLQTLFTQIERSRQNHVFCKIRKTKDMCDLRVLGLAKGSLTQSIYSILQGMKVWIDESRFLLSFSLSEWELQRKLLREVKRCIQTKVELYTEVKVRSYIVSKCSSISSLILNCVNWLQLSPENFSSVGVLKT